MEIVEKWAGNLSFRGLSKGELSRMIKEQSRHPSRVIKGSFIDLDRKVVTTITALPHFLPERERRTLARDLRNADEVSLGELNTKELEVTIFVEQRDHQRHGAKPQRGEQ